MTKYILRFLHEDSTEKYFTCGANPVGKSSETTALLVPSEDAAFKPLVDLLKVCKNNHYPFTFYQTFYFNPEPGDQGRGHHHRQAFSAARSQH